MEQDALSGRSMAERFSDRVANLAGRAGFIAGHVLWFGAWFVLNGGAVPAIHAFDPFPYQFLTLVVSLEAIFLSLFILMSQNRANRQADARSRLDLQINLLAEQESTMILQMLQSLCAYHKLAIAKDPEIETLTARTEPAELLKQLKDGLPEEG